MKVRYFVSQVLPTILLLSMIGGFFLGCPTPPVTVPNLTGLPQSQAETLLSNAGLQTGTVTGAPSNTVPVGHVLEQNPSPGSRVAQGSSVNFTVSTGPAQIDVPAVDGYPVDWATTVIANNHLQTGTIAEIYSDTVLEGIVISQLPLSGTQVDLDTTINLVVSLGPEQGAQGEGELLCTVLLSGDLEVPSIDTDASGVASFYRYASENMVHMVLYHDVQNLTVAHFHVGAPGVNGPIVIHLDTSTNPIEHELTEVEYNQLLINPHYINLHSTEYPPGEIRGDMECTPLPEVDLCTIMLSGDLEVPPVTTEATGTATFHWFAQDEIVRMILHHDVENVSVAHFHSGAPGENGPPVITLDTSTNPIVHDLTIAEYDELMLNPHYINVHSTEYPPGEIRGDLDCSALNID